MQEDQPKKGIGPELSRTVLSGPAYFANNVITTTYGSGVRITFAETNPELPDAAYRGAVYMEPATMLALYGLLGDLIDSNSELKKMLQEVKAQADG